jgi:protein-S-isoprenylcysteine O-methyltransferase Ste14
VDTQTSDNAGVIVLPPILYAATLVSGLLLHWLVPRHPLPSLPARLLGAGLLIGSVLFARWGEKTMRRAGTNVNPNEPSLVIVTAGPFRFTRNPLYVSLAGLYLSVTLLVDALWPLLLLVPLVIVTHYGIILREERYLEAKFGDFYRAYKARVRRYV